MIRFVSNLILHRKIILTDVGEFPHMAAIGYGDEVDETKISFDCGGSLIANVSFEIINDNLLNIIIHSTELCVDCR